MVYKLKMQLISFIAILMGMFPALALDHWNIGFKKQLEQSDKALNHQFRRCNTLKKRPIETIEHPWFNTLSSKEKIAVLLVVSQLSFERCYQVVEMRYAQDLLRYTAETGDHEALNSWLVLRKLYTSFESEQVLNKINWEQLVELSEIDILYYPFDPVQLAKTLKLIEDN